MHADLQTGAVVLLFSLNLCVCLQMIAGTCYEQEVDGGDAVLMRAKACLRFSSYCDSQL